MCCQRVLYKMMGLDYCRKCTDRHAHTHTHRQTDRHSLDHLPYWDNDDTKLTGLHVSSEGTIEDYGLGLLQVMYR